MSSGSGEATARTFSDTEQRPITVLVVDDEQVNLMLLEAILSARGFRVLKASNGEQALTIFQEQPVDLVLMDIMMPGIDGYEVTRRIKSMEGSGFVPVLFVTAFGDDQRLARCIEVGGDDFITKPISRVQLNAKIDAWLRTRELYRTVVWQRDVLAGHQRRLQMEQEIAERVVQRATASSARQSEGVRTHYSPAEILSGDILLATYRPNGNFLAIIGDFTGHGIGAAVGVPSLAETFYAEVDRGADPSQLLDNINARLFRALPPDMFMTVALVEVNFARREVGWWNAGMPPLLLVADGRVIQRAESRELPLGVVDNEALGRRAPEVVTVPAGATLYACSDGIVETTDRAGRLFGSDGMERVVTGATPEEGFDALLAAVETFRGGGERQDDVTLLAIEFDKMFAAGASKPHGMPRNGVWQAELTLDADTLRRLNPVQPVMDLLSNMGAIEEVRQGCYMIIAELFANAVEHGLLKLDSGLKRSPEGFDAYYSERERALAELQAGDIRLRVRYMPEAIRSVIEFELEDSGPGFDFTHHLSRAEGDGMLASNEMASGRGIAFVSALCESLEYFGTGNQVRARYVWSPAD